MFLADGKFIHAASGDGGNPADRLQAPNASHLRESAARRCTARLWCFTALLQQREARFFLEICKKSAETKIWHYQPEADGWRTTELSALLLKFQHI